MTIFVRATAAVKPTSRVAFYVTQVAAALLTIVALAQLFKFEDFPSVLSVYILPGGSATAKLLAALLVAAEVFAVPALVMMSLSPLMRLFSLVCGVSASAIWLLLGLQLLAQGDTVVNNGLFGATLATYSGWLPVLFTACVAPGLGIVLSLMLHNLYKRR